MVRGRLIMIKFWKSLQNILKKFSKLKRPKNDQNILKMTKKLADSNTALKTYWTILNRLLYNKKIPTIPPLLVNGKFVSDFVKKQTFSISFSLLYAHLQIMQVFYGIWQMEQSGGLILFMLLKMIY